MREVKVKKNTENNTHQEKENDSISEQVPSYPASSDSEPEV